MLQSEGHELETFAGDKWAEISQNTKMLNKVYQG